MPANFQQTLGASGLIYTGPGYLAGLVLSSHCAAGVVSGAWFTDGLAGGGTNIFSVEILPGEPYTLFFADRFAPRFVTGLYVTLTANQYLVVWGFGA